MTKNSMRKKQETLGRWGLAITALTLIISSAFLFSTSTSLWLVGGMATIGVVLLWLAMSASPKVAIMLGNFFPLG